MSIGVVVIGRNEAPRLRDCLESCRGEHPVVYVDSGSSDDSVEIAKRWGAAVVRLDPASPYTAARARNEGVDALFAMNPGIRFVQFVDGDCELQGRWITEAAHRVDEDASLAGVAGRLRERHRDDSIYNRLCDMEWDGRSGIVPACGGIAMMRVRAFREVGGFNPALIAGEEPELCVRLRRAGWTIRRIDHDMALHDAAMTRFGQWWRRAVRAGYAYAQGAALHGFSRQRHNFKPVASILFWACAIPLVTVLTATLVHPLGWLIGALYLLLWMRVYRHRRVGRGDSPADARLYASFCVLSKFAQFWGAVRFAAGRWLFRRPARIIEYRGGGGGLKPRCIGYVVGAFPSRSETFVYREVALLRQRGWDVVVHSLHNSPDADAPELLVHRHCTTVLYGSFLTLARDMIAESATHPIRSAATIARAVADMCFPAEPTSALTRAKLPLQGMASLAAARRMRRAGVRHIHCHFAHAPTTIAMYAAAQLGIGFSFTGHANDLFQHRALLARKLDRARFVACISRWHQDHYTSIAPGSARKLALVRCGVDVSNWQPRKSRKDVGEVGTILRVLAVCRLVPKKGIDTLIRGLDSFGRLSQRPWSLTVAGDGPQRAELLRLVEALGCSSCVHWLGSVDNHRIPLLFAQAELFALPCRIDDHGDRDGIPVALMEAMAAGVPVLAGDIPSIRELVEDGATGTCVSGDDPAAVAERIEWIAGHPLEASQMARRAVERVRDEFALEENVARLEREFARCLDVAVQPVPETPQAPVEHLVVQDCAI